MFLDIRSYNGVVHAYPEGNELYKRQGAGQAGIDVAITSTVKD